MSNKLPLYLGFVEEMYGGRIARVIIYDPASGFTTNYTGSILPFADMFLALVAGTEEEYRRFLAKIMEEVKVQ